MKYMESWVVYPKGRTCMPRTTPLHTTHTPPSGSNPHSVGIPCCSSAAHRLRWNVAWRWDQVETPFPLSLTYYFLSQPSWRGWLVRQSPTSGTLSWWIHWGHHQHKITPPFLKPCIWSHQGRSCYPIWAQPSGIKSHPPQNLRSGGTVISPGWHPGTPGRGVYSIKFPYPPWSPNPNNGSGYGRPRDPPCTLPVYLGCSPVKEHN